ncbi:MAG: corrinoid protein [Clostridia bacterium]|nr:corrinoid protein [Clostridia bacterium]
MYHEEIKNAVVNRDKAKTLELVQKSLNEGTSPLNIINEALIPGINIVGDKFETGECFVPDMLLASFVVKEAMNIVSKELTGVPGTEKAAIVLGTVKGDLHDIGKNMVAMILEVSGFKVIDLGVDVHEEDFVQAVREYKPEFLGMSSLITTTMVEMKVVIDALKSAGLRENVKVIIGGAPITEEFAAQIGADVYSRHAALAAKQLKEWL